MTGEGHREQLKAERTPRETSAGGTLLARADLLAAKDKRMLGVAFGIGVLLALVGSTATNGCGECQPSRGGTGGTGSPARGCVEGTWGPP